MYRFPDQYIKKDKFEYSIILSFLKRVTEGITTPGKVKIKNNNNNNKVTIHTHKVDRRLVPEFQRLPERWPERLKHRD